MKSRKKNLMYLQSYSKILKENTENNLQKLDLKFPKKMEKNSEPAEKINSFVYGNTNSKSKNPNNLTWSFNVNFSNLSKDGPKGKINMKSSAMVIPNCKNLSLSNESNLVKFHSQEYSHKKSFNAGINSSKQKFYICVSPEKSKQRKKVSFYLKDTIEESAKENESVNLVKSEILLRRDPKSEIGKLLVWAKTDLDQIIQNKTRETQQSLFQLEKQKQREKQEKRDRNMCRTNLIGDIYLNALINSNKKLLRSGLITKSGFRNGLKSRKVSVQCETRIEPKTQHQTNQKS